MTLAAHDFYIDYKDTDPSINSVLSWTNEGSKDVNVITLRVKDKVLRKHLSNNEDFYLGREMSV